MSALSELMARRAEARYGGKMDRKASLERRALAIHSWIGINGGGKSLGAVLDCLPGLEAGRPLLSTVRILDYENPRPCDDPGCSSPNHATHRAAHPLWIPFTEWRQLLDLDHGDVFMDEVAGVNSSQDATGSIPRPVYKLLQECRRRDIRVTWTAPFWDTAGKLLRRMTQGVTVAEGFYRVQAADESRIWYQNRLFRWRTYDARQWDEFTEGKRDSVPPMVDTRFWGPGSLAFRCYDTFDAVTMIGEVSDSGRCVNCSGTRRAGECVCPDYLERKAERGRGVRGVPAQRGAIAAPSTAGVGGSGNTARRLTVAAPLHS